MKIKLEKSILLSAILILSLFTTACGNRFSMSNPDIQKLTLKAQTLIQEGDFDGAIGRLESINDLNPNIAGNNYNLGIAYYKTNQYEKAINSLENAINLDKKLKDAYYTLAVIHEEIANENVEKFEKNKSEKEKQIIALKEVVENYKKSLYNYSLYMDFIESGSESELISKKLVEFETQLDKNSEALSKLGIDEKTKD